MGRSQLGIWLAARQGCEAEGRLTGDEIKPDHRCDEVGQSPGLGAAPTLYASSGVRSPSDECGRRVL